MDRFRAFIEEKLHVIDEAKQEAGEFIMQIGLVFLNEFGAGHSRNSRLQRLFGFRASLLVGEGRNGVALIGRLRGHAVGTRRAGR